MRREGLVRHHLLDTKHLTEELTTLTRVKLQRAQSRYAFIVAVEGGGDGRDTKELRETQGKPRRRSPECVVVLSR